MCVSHEYVYVCMCVYMYMHACVHMCARVCIMCVCVCEVYIHSVVATVDFIVMGLHCNTMTIITWSFWACNIATLYLRNIFVRTRCIVTGQSNND